MCLGGLGDFSKVLASIDSIEFMEDESIVGEDLVFLGVEVCEAFPLFFWLSK